MSARSFAINCVQFLSMLCLSQADNVMLDFEHKVVKLIDFGSLQTGSCDNGSISLENFTLPFMPPEKVEGMAYDRKADIWAFGCVIVEMATAKFGVGLWYASAVTDADHFGDWSSREVQKAEVSETTCNECGLSSLPDINNQVNKSLQEKQYSKLLIGNHEISGKYAILHIIATLLGGGCPRMPTTVSARTKAFALLCFQSDPAKRPAAHKLLLSPYLASTNSMGQWSSNEQQDWMRNLKQHRMELSADSVGFKEHLATRELICDGEQMGIFWHDLVKREEITSRQACVLYSTTQVSVT